MLRALTITNFVIVDHLELDFESGFSALTGETGAGKSILIDALSLALGARADGNPVRVGQNKAEITAEFALNYLPSARQWLAESDLADDDVNICLFRRVIDTSGRSKAFINGSSVTLSQMRDLGQRLVDIHGQHEHQRLLRRDAQLALLDDFAANAAIRDAVSTAHAEWSQIANIRAARQQNEAAIAREFEDVSWQIRELEKLNFTPARWEETLAEQRRLANATSLISAAEGAIDGLAESDNAVISTIDALASELGVAAQTDAALRDIHGLMTTARVELSEAVSSLRHYLRKLEVDPAKLAERDGEISDVLELARKFRIEPSRIPDYLQQKRDRLASLGGGQSLDDLIVREQLAEAAYREVAKELTKSRQEAAKTFSAQITASLQELAMPGGLFAVEFVAREAGPSGLEGCEFQVAAHEGQTLGPLAKIASGGELSRVSLAIQMMASARGGVPTMIFDEVDSGIGGRVAEVVGRLLRRLGEKQGEKAGAKDEGKHQVLAVTHLPQVAACAEYQFQVSKGASDVVVTTNIVLLNKKARIEEIARMLGGMTITATTRKHAEEMLASAAKA
ncbi:MAG: DNA repair protein RecN [Rhodocyclaceae bacterium]|jgi:DNA repair protein RecN (Recombination protein N)|nr:DNA repair protein RecN [Rhodocyclaceae bacterium]MCA3020650.1 DNA repair protein RecN [Rhodocyclaceae bacterium]MCA3044578.1 DNA repair protein RecN [Rhodocyclaceae bacterium]MCA3052318.1 DNA repair protein RecN [Rhodocyclaceae bacterium]MCA3054780.1 DNA repair protein RecN [Rhodocyclaceae bacterium]